MEANFEWELLTRIVKTSSLKDVLEWGVRTEDFGITQARGVFDYICSLYMNRGSAGSIAGDHTLALIYPEFQHRGDDTVTLEFLCQQVRRGYQVREGKRLAEKFVEDVDVDVGEALNMLAAQSRKLLELGVSKNSDVGMADGMNRLMSMYRRRQLGLVKPKFLLPWPLLNEKLGGGVCDEDYFVFYGRPKQMKSWVLALCAGYAVEQDLRVGVYTKEMTPATMRARITVSSLKLPYEDFKNGQLTTPQETELVQYAEHWTNYYGRGDLVMLDASDIDSGGDTIAWLESKIDRYELDVVFIDGLHLMSAPSKREQPDHQRVHGISKQVRQMVLRKRVPVIATIHANRKAAGHSEGNLDEISYSDGVGQDVTLAVRTIREKHKGTIALIIAGAREFELEGLRINGRVAEDFSQLEEIGQEEVVAISQRESEGRLQKKAAKKKTMGANDNDNGKADGPLPGDAEALVDRHWKQMGLRH
jgi:replicative DNA helicase